MRDTIKIVIALAFTIGAVWVCRYMDNERCSSQLNETNSRVDSENKIILKLRDSLNVLKIELEKEKVVFDSTNKKNKNSKRTD